MIILLDDFECFFFINGDSGVIVLIIFDGKYFGIGLIYGGSFEYWEVEINIYRNESIVIFLKNVLDWFLKEKNMSIEFDRI